MPGATTCRHGFSTSKDADIAQVMIRHGVVVARKPPMSVGAESSRSPVIRAGVRNQSRNMVHVGDVIEGKNARSTAEPVES